LIGVVSFTVLVSDTLGQKQTFRSAIAMSALPLKADIKSARRNFCQVPEADNRARNLREHAI
jgi:hypothetical protein